MKQCFKCKEIFSLNFFHKHKKMLDGHLNKCKFCVKKDVDVWRTKNPMCRKIEYAKHSKKLGTRTREQYYIDIKASAIGRKVSINKYAHKRRLQTFIKDELTEFAIEEAILLRELRNKMLPFKWHVDHIIPLNSKYVCGLHTAFNFQVISAQENLKKSNKLVSGY